MAAGTDFSSILLPEGPWDETDVPMHERGVRLGWIEEFVRHIYAPRVKRGERQLEKRDEAERINHQSGLFDGFQPRFVAVDDIRGFQLTTRELVSEYVVPLTMASKAPLYSRVPAHERGTPSVFLSHAWSSLVLDIPTMDQVVRGTLDAFLKNSATHKDEFVWIDFVSYNQHKLSQDSIAFDMEALIRSIGRVAFAVTHTPLFNRLWCLWELVAVHRTDAETEFRSYGHGRVELGQFADMFCDSFESIEQADATNISDKKQLLSAMVEVFGSIDRADSRIRSLMREKIPFNSYRRHADYTRKNVDYGILGPQLTLPKRDLAPRQGWLQRLFGRR